MGRGLVKKDDEIVILSFPTKKTHLAPPLLRNGLRPLRHPRRRCGRPPGASGVAMTGAKREWGTGGARAGEGRRASEAKKKKREAPPPPYQPDPGAANPFPRLVARPPRGRRPPGPEHAGRPTRATSNRCITSSRGDAGGRGARGGQGTPPAENRRTPSTPRARAWSSLPTPSSSAALTPHGRPPPPRSHTHTHSPSAPRRPSSSTAPTGPPSWGPSPPRPPTSRASTRATMGGTRRGCPPTRRPLPGTARSRSSTRGGPCWAPWAA